MTQINVVPDEQLGEVLLLLDADVIMPQSVFDSLCEITGKSEEQVLDEIQSMDYSFGGEADHMIDVATCEDHYFFTLATSHLGFE